VFGESLNNTNKVWDIMKTMNFDEFCFGNELNIFLTRFEQIDIHNEIKETVEIVPSSLDRIVNEVEDVWKTFQSIDDGCSAGLLN